MLLKNFIVLIASGVAIPITSSSSNPLYVKATTGKDYKIRSYNDSIKSKLYQ